MRGNYSVKSIDKTTVEKLVKQKASIAAICEAVGVSRSALYYFSHKQGVRLSQHRLVPAPIEIKRLIHAGKTQREVMQILNISRTTVRYWLKKQGETVRHLRSCALFECGKPFTSVLPNKLCCCYTHTNRHLKRNGAKVTIATCALPECGATFLSVGGHRSWCCKDHHELHRRRLNKWGFYSRILGVDSAKCLVCDERVVLDSHHTSFKRKSRPSPEVWLCPTHHMKIHRGLAKIENGAYVDLVPLILSGLKEKWPQLVTDVESGAHRRTAPSGASFMRMEATPVVKPA